MPIRHLQEITNKSHSFQKGFLQNCYIYEKISSFYFHVKIKSPSSLGFYKSNTKEIEVDDLILNRMWNIPIQDFTSMFLSDKEFMEKCVGFTFSFFFFPTANPLGIDYSDSEDGSISYRYILDHITTPKKQSRIVGYINEFARMDKNHLIRPNGICVKNGNRTPKEIKTISEAIKSKNPNYIIGVMKGMIEKDKICAQGIDNSEGFILRSDNEVYQIVNEKLKPLEVKNNRLALEIFIHNFSDFLSKTEYTECLISNNYITNVCHVMLKYKEWLDEPQNHQMFEFYNIKAEDLQSPTFGYYGGTYYELIPVKGVRELCYQSEFWDNVFKILLNGLKKQKRFNENDLIITKNDTEVWNTLVSVLSVYKKMNKGLNLQKLIH